MEGIAGPPAANGLFERLYARLGDRYLMVLLAGAAASIPGLTVLASAVLVSYTGANAGEYFEVLAVGVPWMAVVGLASQTAVARVMAALRSWQRAGRPSDAASAAWRAAVLELPRAVVLGGGIVVLGAVPVTVWGGTRFGLDGAGSLTAVGAVTAFILAGAALHFLIWERALRPIVLDAAAQLPERFKAGANSLTLGARLLMLIPIMSVLTALAAVGLTDGDYGAAGRLGIAIAVALGITAAIAVPLTLMLRASLLLPLNALLTSMDKVERGNLDARLPVVSADEIGTVAHHFNSMLEGLHERQRFADENSRLVGELQASRGRIVGAADTARRRIERDLHDGAQQHLVILNLKLGLARRKVEADDEAARLVDDARDELARALDELRDLAHGIYPAVLTSDGLAAALAEAAQHAPIPTSVDGGGIGRSPADVEAAVYFCCLEALQNAGKHAGEGARATISLEERDGELRFEVRDDGRGFDQNGATAESAGLQNMADRIGALGGELRVDSARGRGTSVIGRIPLTGAAPP